MPDSFTDFRTRHARAIALVAAHCDIEERLDLAPPTARLRGVLFGAITTEVKAHGVLDQYRDFFPTDFGAISYHPLSEYLVRIAVAGALIASPERVHAGMYEISLGNAKTFAESLLGRTLIRLLARDPVRLVEQAIAARRQMATYGQWSIERRGPTAIAVHYANEYTWIESAIAGSAAGTFEGQRIKVAIETHMTDRFNGSTFFSW